MKKAIPKHWELTEEQVGKIYEVEKAHAAQLRNATSATERRKLYGPVYRSYFEQLPFHPQFTIKSDTSKNKERNNFQLAQILPFLNSQTTLLEIGAGDCGLSIAASVFCKEVIALEVSDEIIAGLKFPDNVKCLIFDGFNVPLPVNSVDVAYSNQLMEHLHPDDAIAQVESIYNVLKKGGVYICITPNQLLGPNDISRFFTNELVGFHLKEYTASDLKKLFISVGFKKVIIYSILRGKRIIIPYPLVWLVEKIFGLISVSKREKLSGIRFFNIILNAAVGAIK